MRGVFFFNLHVWQQASAPPCRALPAWLAPWPTPASAWPPGGETLALSSAQTAQIAPPSRTWQLSTCPGRLGSSAASQPAGRSSGRRPTFRFRNWKYKSYVTFEWIHFFPFENAKIHYTPPFSLMYFLHLVDTTHYYVILAGLFWTKSENSVPTFFRKSVPVFLPQNAVQ